MMIRPVWTHIRLFICAVLSEPSVIALAVCWSSHEEAQVVFCAYCGREILVNKIEFASFTRFYLSLPITRLPLYLSLPCPAFLPFHFISSLFCPSSSPSPLPCSASLPLHLISFLYFFSPILISFLFCFSSYPFHLFAVLLFFS